MTRTILSAALGVALVSCTSISEKYAGRRYPFNPEKPKVYVVDNDAQSCADKKTYIVVDQEPIYFFKAKPAKQFTIEWTLQTPDYSFDPNKKVMQPKALFGPPNEIHDCRVTGAKTMQCTNDGQNSGAWKYTLSVQADPRSSSNPCPVSPRDLDPIIAND